MSRAKRKWDHIKYALETGQKRKTGLDDISFIHQSIPGTSLDSITLATKIGELVLSSPIFINAMTGGGGSKTLEINRDLATLARKTGIGMAVGSQMSALKNPEESETFKIVREVNPDGIIFANLGSEATVEQAKQAIDMVHADALQIHLNVVQELTMPEGDRDFSGALTRIRKIVEAVDTPIIIKETGFGMGLETVEKLIAIGVHAIDISGFGGTNFAMIENRRRENELSFFEDWGIPTVASIAEARHVNESFPVIASGGIQSSHDIAKVLALGANSVGLAGHILKILLDRGLDETILEINQIHSELTMIMAALGASTIDELKNAPLLITGKIWHRLNERGIDTKKYSLRSK